MTVQVPGTEASGQVTKFEVRRSIPNAGMLAREPASPGYRVLFERTGAFEARPIDFLVGVGLAGSGTNAGHMRGGVHPGARAFSVSLTLAGRPPPLRMDQFCVLSHKGSPSGVRRPSRTNG